MCYLNPSGVMGNWKWAPKVSFTSIRPQILIDQYRRLVKFVKSRSDGHVD